MRYDHIGQDLIGQLGKTARPDSLVPSQSLRNVNCKPLYLWLQVCGHSTIHTSLGGQTMKTMQHPGVVPKSRKNEKKFQKFPGLCSNKLETPC